MIRFGQLWIAILFVSAALVAQDQPPSLKIHLYNRAGVPQITLDEAEDRASRIFRQSGIATTWYNCSVQGNAGAKCSGPLERDAVVVQIIPDTKKLNSEIFGTAFIGTSGYGSYADIFFDRAQRLSGEAKVDVAEILGHVISHEIGHLLLGTDSHSARGIMLAHWESEALKQADRGHLLFSKAQSQAMQKRVTFISSEATESAGGR